MAEQRVITSAIFRDEWFGPLPLFHQTLWIGLFAACADDQGRFMDNLALIRAAVSPYKQVSTKRIDNALADFEKAGKIIRYEADGNRLIQIANWWDHQHPQWAARSKYPAPDGWVDRVRTKHSGQYVEENWRSDSTKRQIQVKQPHAPADQPPVLSGETSGERSPERSPEPTPELPGEASADGQVLSTTNTKTIHDDTTVVPKADTPTNFAEWLSLVEKSKNRQAALMRMFSTLFHGREPPTFAYLGSTATKVGGAGRLCELLWTASAKPPTGDVMAYCLSMHKRPSAKARDRPDLTDTSRYQKAAEAAQKAGAKVTVMEKS